MESYLNPKLIQDFVLFCFIEEHFFATHVNTKHILFRKIFENLIFRSPLRMRFKICFTGTYYKTCQMRSNSFNFSTGNRFSKFTFHYMKTL